ncbi:BTAD domain-containing putative transcriptional regulator [Amycolatopsis sp. NPDC054798]
MGVEFGVLGDVQARIDGRLADIGHARQRCVLAVLLAEANQTVSVDQLVERVWDGCLPRHPRDTLYRYLSLLRRSLRGAEGAAIVRRPAGYVLTADPDTVDLHRFTRLLEEARAADDDERAACLFEEALGLWRGPAFTGLDTPWFTAVRTALDAERRSAALDHADIRLRGGKHAELLPALNDRAVQYPLDERIAGQLMLALYRSGRQADALEHYQQIRGRLAEELGIDPGPPLQALHRRILTADLELSVATATKSAESAGNAPRIAPQLPAGPPLFTGRAAELDRILASASDFASSIVIHAIDGMPGVGKTALGLRAAHLLGPHCPDGQLFVPLHGHSPDQQPRSPFDALREILTMLDVHPSAIAGHKTVEDRARLWRSLIPGRRMLLVLDDAATYEQIAPLLPSTPGCPVLVTSRNRLLELDGALPLSVDVLSPGDAERMLLRLARRAPSPRDSGELARVVALCGRLPLAIAITASQLRAHPAWDLRYLADQLAHDHDRLAELQSGQRSVRAAFDASLRDLPAELRDLFVLLGIHPGPEIDKHAAAALADTTPASAGRSLESLYSRHLLEESTPGRYRLHDLLRAHARDRAARLDAEERDRAVARILEYYLHAARAAARQLPAWRLPGPPVAPAIPAHPCPVGDAGQARGWLRAETATVVSVVELAAQHAAFSARSVQLAAAMHDFLRTQGNWDRALRIHQTALRAASRADDRAGQARTLVNIGDVQRVRGDYEAAASSLARAHGLFTDLDDPLGQATALTVLGFVEYGRADLAAAAADLDRAYALFADLGNALGQADVLDILGLVQRVRGDYEAAASSLARAHRLFTDLDNPLGQATTLTTLGDVQRLRGDYEAAATSLTRAHTLHTDLDNPLGQAMALLILGDVQRLQGDYEAAEASLARARSLHAELGNRHGLANVELGLGLLLHRTGRLTSATESLNQALALFTELGDPDGEAETRNALGELALTHPAAGDPRAHFDAALGLARASGSDLPEANALAGQARCLLPADVAGAARLLGQALTIHRRLGVPEAKQTAALLASL